MSTRLSTARSNKRAQHTATDEQGGTQEKEKEEEQEGGLIHGREVN